MGSGISPFAAPPARIAARQYLRLGMAPIPVPFMHKKPVLKGWPELRLNSDNVPEYFNKPKQNIGILLGVQGLVDIDIDCPEAESVAHLFLPPTDFVFGHGSRPSSHRFYRANQSLISDRFIDPTQDDDSMIIEQRCLKRDGSIGFQTIVPPSTHKETGQAISFSRFGIDSIPAPSIVDASELQKGVRNIAACTLISRHFFAQNYGAGQLWLIAEVLERGGYTKIETERFLDGIKRILRASWGKTPDDDTQVLMSERAVQSPDISPQCHKKEEEIQKVLDSTLVSTALGWLGILKTSNCKETSKCLLPDSEDSRGADTLRWSVMRGACVKKAWVSEQSMRPYGRKTAHAASRPIIRNMFAEYPKALLSGHLK